MDEQKQCYVCGRQFDQNELTFEDRKNNLHQSDIELIHCRRCGKCVCGFCEHLGVCCE